MARGRGRGRGGGRGGGRGTQPATRRRTRSNPGPEDEAHVENENHEVHNEETNEQPTMASEFARMLQTAIPTIAAEIRRQERDGYDGETGAGTGNGTGAGTGTATGSGAATGGGTCDGAGATGMNMNRDAGLGTQNRGCDYKAFKNCDPPQFDGKQGAIATYEWIHRMEAVIRISQCRADQAVLFAAHSFVMEALHWWDAVRQARGDQAIAELGWNDLKNLVLERFCPEGELNKLEMEFLNIDAGTMTHQEYTFKYNELSRLVPDAVNTEEKRIKNYLRGLPANVRQVVRTAKPSTFQSAMDLSAGGV